MSRHEPHTISEEQLNAYFDNELDFEERKRVDEQLRQSAKLTQEELQLHQLHNMLRNAYRHPPRPPRRNKVDSQNRLARNAFAASILLAVGALVGWYGNQRFVNAPPVDPVTFNRDVRLNTSVTASENLLLHISSKDPQKMEALLNYAEQVLTQARSRKQKSFRLEVVANDGGIELLRRDTSPFQQRIEVLLNEYDNVSFLVCANALRKLHEQGVKIELLPGTHSEHSAIDAIINRLERG